MTESDRRTAAGARLSEALASGEVMLQCCEDCGATQYPPAEVCRECLADTLVWRPLVAAGEVVASALIHRSYRNDFNEGGPWPVVSVRLDAGPVVFAHAVRALSRGVRVRLVALKDSLGCGVFGAVDEETAAEALQARFEHNA